MVNNRNRIVPKVDNFPKNPAIRYARTTPRTKLQLKTILYLDVVRKGSNFVFETYSIFDVLNSYSYLTDSQKLDNYQNIYFDLTEVYRRKLAAELIKSNVQFEDIEGIYFAINNQLIEAQKQMESEAFGWKENKLIKWNNLIRNELGIDNFKMFMLE